MHEPAIRRLVVVLGDQLNRDSAAFDDFDREHDCVWMAEVPAEATHVWSHQARIALFLSAMRHFRATLQEDGLRVVYHRLGRHHHRTLERALRSDLARLQPQQLIMAGAGEFRLQQEIEQAAMESGWPLSIREDRHFLMTVPEFTAWSAGKTTLRTEHLYRHLRERESILMDHGKPLGGRWNFDADNRKSFGRGGPGPIPRPRPFAPDAITREVVRDVRAQFQNHPGRLDAFDWPATPPAARQALEDFIAHRLPLFGAYQDAMWAGEPFVYHSRLATALNLKLISPREVLDRSVEAYHCGHVPLQAVEGFVRQILGWRELVRGVYWTRMPGYLGLNALNAHQPLPRFYWTGQTEMACLREVIGQTLEYGYAHHIQRLMVTGLFALLVGVEPKQVHAWYLAVYTDAVEWVELPNTFGMSQYADGGIIASKPYVASGRYIERMSNYCRNCRFLPGLPLGVEACPFTTLYWDFLVRHRARFERHPRTAQQWRNLARFDHDTLRAIATTAAHLRDHLAST